MSVAPECEHEVDQLDHYEDCDVIATHEVVIRAPYSSRSLFVCDGHLDAAIADHPSALIVPLTANGTRPDACTVPAPEGYECTRIPHAEGPCALREVPTPAPMGLLTVPVPTKYRPSKWSTPWILLLGLIGYELWAVATSKAGGPLSHLVWWTYGERWSLRWWLCSSALNGLGLWAAAHFMFEWPEVKELLITVVCALGVGLVGWYVTR